MDTLFIYFCPPDALCRQQWHLCQGALAGCQTPQSHQIPPNLISPSPEELGAEAGSWLSFHIPFLEYVPSCPILSPPPGQSALSAFLLCFGDGSWYFPASGNNIEWALSLPRKYRSRVLMAFTNEPRGVSLGTAAGADNSGKAQPHSSERTFTPIHVPSTR